MPQQSSRQNILADLQDALVICNTFSRDLLSPFTSDSNSSMDLTYDEDNDFAAAASVIQEIIIAIEPRQYIVTRTRSERSIDFVINYFMDQPDHEFRKSVRTTKVCMGKLWHEIRDHPVFHNNSNFRQRNSVIQLAVALERFGSYGDGASLGQIAITYGIGKASAHEYTKRVITAVRALRAKYIAWPDVNRRRQISEEMSQEGFNGCVGIVDGTTIPLFQKPGIDGEMYRDRKSQYSLNTQVVCDFDNKIILAYTGCPGSMENATVFRRLDVSKEPTNYFSNGEYLIGNSEYELTNHMITPYKSPATHLPENQVFNTLLARLLARNEHTISILKDRWASLKELRVAINRREDAEHAVRWIVTCCTLHNIMPELGDGWEEMTLNTESDDSSYVNHPVASSSSIELRERAKENVLRLNSEGGTTRPTSE